MRTSSSAVSAPSRRCSSRAAAASPSGAASGAAGSIPKLSSTSAAHVTGVAPSRRSAFVPAESALVISPGTASTSLPSSSAKSAVIERAAPLPRLDHHSRPAEAGDDPIPRREAPRRRLDARLVLGDDEAALADLARELRMRGRVVAVDAAAENGDGLSRLERAAMRLAVDAARHPAHDDEPGCGELPPERAGDRAAVRRARPRADDRDRRPLEQILGAAPRRNSAGGGSWIAASSDRECRVAPPQPPDLGHDAGIR